VFYTLFNQVWKEETQMFTVTFYTYSQILKKGFSNTEIHSDFTAIRIRAMALNFQVTKVIDANGDEVSLDSVWGN